MKIEPEERYGHRDYKWKRAGLLAGKGVVDILDKDQTRNRHRSGQRLPHELRHRTELEAVVQHAEAEDDGAAQQEAKQAQGFVGVHPRDRQHLRGQHCNREAAKQRQPTELGYALAVAFEQAASAWSAGNTQAVAKPHRHRH